tara:strand:+ start:14122 stop:18585 length:4464 start_codon:yes stop_codon:yes gene_type:complete
MSRRYVKKAKWDALGKVTPEVVAVVSAKNNLNTANDSQTYFKRNYLEAVKQIIPNLYFTDEATISGTHISFPNQLINSHITAVKNQSTVLPLSGLTYDVNLSSLNTPQGLAPYFYKTKSPAQIDADDFNRDILVPLGKSLSQFETSGAFAHYVSGTLLPMIPSVHAGHHATDNLASLTTSAYANDSSGTYKYLADNLGMVYFLNRTGPEYDASTALPLLLTETIWKGRPLVLEDTLNVFEEYMWRNESNWALSDKIIPTSYVSSVDMSADTYTSGTQLLERLKTLNSVVYSPEFLNSADSKLETAFSTFFSTSSISSDGTLITDTTEAGPLTRFLEAMSYSIADGVGEQAELNTLYDIGKCPQEYLELLGELIGWKFIGSDFDKWRVQLRNAVDIYKMKGTKRSVQFLLDTMFSEGVFDATGTENLTELWESYIPDMIYYSLATSSAAFNDFKTYTPELALQFGVTDYDPNSMDKNIRFVVDKMIFDLVREFPNSFLMGGKPFPVPQLLLNGEPYLEAYNIVPNLNPPVPNEVHFPTFYTGSRKTTDSQLLTLDVNEDFLFNYRGRIYLVPPYEKRQFYTNTQVSRGLLDRIDYYLRCYGVDSSFAKEVVDYIRNNSTDSLATNTVLNNFLLFTTKKEYPPNYDNILQDSTKHRTPDPISLLSMWNGKSSHFQMNFNSSSFDWSSEQLNSTTKYGITKVLRVLDQVVPAHSIPDILVTVSAVADGMDSLDDNDCREWRPNFSDRYEGSSTVTTGFATCAVDMLALATANGIEQHRFKRTQADGVNDVMLSGATYVAVARNSMRRRNYHHLLPENKMFTRGGRNNPGSLELSTSFYSSGIGYLPLGFMPSALKFKEVATRQNDAEEGIGTLIDRDNLDGVWDICMNLTSPSSVFGYNVSNTFASRAKQTVTTSDCNTYGRRGDLDEILYVMNSIHDQEKYLQASSIVSGYYEDVIAGVTPTVTSSLLLVPTDFSAWYAQDAKHFGLDVPKSMGNYLINQESADQSLNYYEHFKFGRSVHELFNTYLTTYAGHGTANLYDIRGGPNIFTHTYGPLIYNSNLDSDGSALDASGYLSASAPSYEVDLAYYGGSGVLSLSGMNGKGAYDLGTSAASSAGDLPLTRPEFRNRHMLSSIEIVDTSTAHTFDQHPTFSIFKYSRDSQSKYSYAKYLMNNQILKYHRSTSPDTLPRVRVNIDNTDANDLSRNFLEPNHEYEVTVKAHNIDASSTDIGGQSLSLWVHTQPEQDQVWSYKIAKDDCAQYVGAWEPLNVLDVSGPAGINIATNKAQSKPFLKGTLDSVVGSGEGNFDPNAPLTDNDYDYRCWEPQFLGHKGSNPQAISNIGVKTLNEIKFKFSTHNNSTIKLSETYLDSIGNKLHRTDQKYTLELFTTQGHLSKFVVIETIEIKDVTNYNKAVISTAYGDAQLDISNLKTVFRFLKGLSTGLASRNATITSGTLETSGGARLNYRSNSSMYNTKSEANTQLTEVKFYEG